MNILFFSHYFHPEGNAPASRVLATTREWVKAGHKVTVITCAPNVPNGVVYDGYKNKLFHKEEIEGVTVIRVWTYIAPNKGTKRRILNFISYMFNAVFFTLFTKRPDVIIATSPQFFCGWAGVFSKYLFFGKVPFILEIRDIWPESITTVGVEIPRKIINILEKMEHMMYAAADHIVTVGEGYRQQLLNKSVSSEKISIIMNGVDSDIFSPREQDVELIEEFNLQNKFVCSYIGTIGMACGLDVVINAAIDLKKQKHDNIVFLIVGSGARLDELKEKAGKLQLDNIIFTGRRPKEDMPRFLSITDACFIHLKKAELFATVIPSKIFEAAGMARAIIIAVKGHATDIILEANAGLAIEPEDKDQLIDAIMKLADSPELKDTFGKSGYKAITKKYERTKLSLDYLDILNNFTKNK
jgi:glycosyltransferase involved in cell wall biosynthesis